ncbi:helix-turn-helix domain-containing protein [Ruminococcus sp.]|uniref:helix-turn-helix domain-containing protein n=1 Tax=Ruminococcus sp. TaxID=41978 RepID=UPI0025E112EA|nr:helix-turn-helix domain-containing protein [Ruminococcus sp.]
MAYCKVEVNTGFTVISNELMRDKRITLKAKGLQALILSLPPEWDMTIEGLSAICVECSDTISSILKELEAAGYLSRYNKPYFEV